MKHYNDDAFAQIKKNLDSIPKEIDTTIFVKDLLKLMDEQLKKDLRRRVSYG